MNTLPSAAVVLAASFAASLSLTGCDSMNRMYKRDTGEMPAVAAPQPVFTPIAMPEPVGGDPLAEPEVLAGEAPGAIQPLEAPTQPVEVEVMETYVVQKGDTFGHISQKLYGTVNRTKDLITANPEINPMKMQIGDVLNVPR